MSKQNIKSSNFKQFNHEKNNTHDVLILAEDTENCFYAQIIKNIGIGFQVELTDGNVTIASLSGKMIKRIWCNTGDVVIVKLDLRNYIIVHKYKSHEVIQLKELGKVQFDNLLPQMKKSDIINRKNIIIEPKYKQDNKESKNVCNEVNQNYLDNKVKESKKLEKRFNDKVRGNKIVIDLKRSRARDNKGTRS